MRIPNFLKPSKKRLIILGIFLIIVIIGFNFFGRKKQTPLQFAQVKKQDIRSTVSSSGNLTGKSIVNLKFKSSGKLVFVNVKTGDQVSQFQTVASQDTKDLSITLQQAQNTLRDKQAIVDKIRDDVKDHDKDETFTQKQSRTTAEVARDNAFDSVKAAQRDFEDAVIISPISGLVTQAIQTWGQTVTSSDLIAQVVDTSGIYFDTDVDEADIAKITSGQKTEINLDAYPDKTFAGQVDQILPQTKTTSSGATVVTVRIKLDNPPSNFVNGLTGQTSIILEQNKNALTLPLESVRDDNMIFIQTSQGLTAKKIETGIKSDTDVEITNGVNEGDKVLLNPPASGTVLNRNSIQGVIFRMFGGGRV